MLTKWNLNKKLKKQNNKKFIVFYDFYFEIILDTQKVTEIVQRIPVNPS